MKQETIIQILALIIISSLTLFYNPISADLEGKIIFFGIILVIVVFYIVFDLYKLIEENRIKIKLFNEKFNLLERIKNLEGLKKI